MWGIQELRGPVLQQISVHFVVRVYESTRVISVEIKERPVRDARREPVL